MATIDSLASEFLAQKCIAVAGVTDGADNTANFIARALRARGIEVLPVNPRIAQFLDGPCYPDLASLPRTPDGMMIVTSPAVAELLVRQCVDAGIRRVWLHGALGTRPRLMKSVAAKITSVSPEAVRICREHGITVIPGSCPMQFMGDTVHTCLRGVLRMTGALEIPA